MRRPAPKRTKGSDVSVDDIDGANRKAKPKKKVCGVVLSSPLVDKLCIVR